MEWKQALQRLKTRGAKYPTITYGLPEHISRYDAMDVSCLMIMYCELN
jgi:hypothetical protein